MILGQSRGGRTPRKMPARNGSGFVRPPSDRDAGQNSLADPQARVARYTSLAMSASASGDHVQAERYHQHAEHYRKMLHKIGD